MNFRILTVLYFLALSVELFANLTKNVGVQYFSKPSLMLILIFYYATNTRKLSAIKHSITAALVFSWFGDVLLLLDKQFKGFFIYGLVAFLSAHLCYIYYFWKIRRLNKIEKLPNPLVFVAIGSYSLALFAYLAPNVKNLLVPVAVYALVISTMLGASLTAFDTGRQKFGQFCIAGTLLFVVSDSILAVNRFAASFEYAPVFVMLTYALAQLLITEGSLRNLKAISHELHELHE